MNKQFDMEFDASRSSGDCRPTESSPEREPMQVLDFTKATNPSETRELFSKARQLFGRALERKFTANAECANQKF